MPEPILISIAAALAGKGATALYELAKSKLAGRPSANAALEAVKGHAADSPEVGALADHLASAADEDPQFRERLIAAHAAAGVEQSGSTGAVNNQISGTVSGNVLQARDVHGNITFGR